MNVVAASGPAGLRSKPAALTAAPAKILRKHGVRITFASLDLTKPLPADRPTSAAPVIVFDQESRTGPGICLRAAQLAAWNFDNNRIDVCSSGGAIGTSVNYFTLVHEGRQTLAVARAATGLPQNIRPQLTEFVDADG